jgi:3'(2'), 5'-bisphosphate nucleotidase
MTAPDLPSLLELAGRLARDAGAIIMDFRARGFAVDRKHDRTPVTEADHAAEAAILAGLAQTGIPVVAEEQAASGIVMHASALYWLVDPLDGTREFAAGRDSFTVNIGLVAHDRPLLGAVHLPAHGQLFLGGPGLGAWREDASGRHAISARRVPAEGATMYGSRHYADNPRLADFAAAHRVAKIINIGSAEKFCRVAEGAGDLYPRFGPTMEWDTAAPQAVVEAAGGSCTTFDGAPLRYGKPGWRNPDFLVRGGA